MLSRQQEELQRMKDDQASSMDIIGRYIARFGELDAMASAGMLDAGIEPDRNLDATIVQVRRGGERSYAEINASLFRGGSHWKRSFWVFGRPVQRMGGRET